MPMHEVVPKVVAMAVRMVASRWMIFWMISFLFMVFGVMRFEFFSPRSTQSFFLPLMKGARGMFTPKGFSSIEHHTESKPMEHPPYPLHKGDSLLYVILKGA